MQSLILLHGALGSAGQLDHISSLFERQFRIHSFDFPGHGQNSYDGKFCMDLFSDSILRYIQSHRLFQPLVFGYSMGGYAALHLERKHPGTFSGIITLGTKFRWTPEIAAKETQLLDPEQTLNKVPAFAEELEKRHSENDWKKLMHNTAALLRDMGNHPPLTETDFSAIQTETLILLGDRDRMVDVEETVHTYRLMPNARMGILPDTPHPIEKVNLPVLKAMVGHCI